MKFEIRVGPQSEHVVAYSRNWFSGEEWLRANGHPVAEKSAGSLSTHVNLELKWRQEFQLPGSPPLLLAFERERPLFFAGFRRHTYRLFVNGQVVFERRGY